MRENPYQSPGDGTLPPDDSIAGLRSYHVPFILAAVCGLALATLLKVVPHEFIFRADRRMGFFGGCFGFLVATLVFDVPVCVWILCECYRTGEPPKLTLEPLIDSAETRVFRRTLKHRARLDDEAFYTTFYADSGIAKDVVIRVRKELQRMLGRSLAGIHPRDDIGLLEPAIDLADVLDVLAEQFQMLIPWQTTEIDVDGSFDSFVRLVADCKVKNNTAAPTPEREAFTIRLRRLPFIVALACVATLMITSNVTWLDLQDAIIWVVIPTAILVLDLPVCAWILRRGKE